MSLLSIALRDRVIESSPNLDGSTTSLADLAPGSSAVIVDVRSDVDPGTARRFVDLGFAPGAPVVAVRRAPLADPVIFRVAGGEVALRRRQAGCILVRVDA